MTESFSNPINCPHCAKSDAIKYGRTKGGQRYSCKSCRTTFVDNGAEPGRRVPPEQVGAAVSLFYDGLSVEDIRRNFKTLYGFEPSAASVYEWIEDYSKLAGREVKTTGPTELGNTWVADELVTKIGGGNVWVWTVMDGRSRFILASHVSRTRTIRDAETLFREAHRNSGGRAPKVLITDGLAAYVEGSDRVFGLRTHHDVSGGIRAEDNNNLMERLNGTIRERTKVMRGMKSKETAETVLDGWNLHYNYMRPHEALGGKTPAQVAKSETSLKNWEDVARLDVRPVSHARSQAERIHYAENLGTGRRRAVVRARRPLRDSDIPPEFRRKSAAFIGNPQISRKRLLSDLGASRQDVIPQPRYREFQRKIRIVP